jgi:hypothetical protein
MKMDIFFPWNRVRERRKLAKFWKVCTLKRLFQEGQEAKTQQRGHDQVLQELF